MRYLATISAVALAAFVFAACGGSTEQESGSTKQESSAPAGSKAPHPALDISVSEAVDALPAANIIETCEAYEDAGGYGDLARAAWLEGFGDAADDFPFTADEVLNEILTRC